MGLSDVRIIARTKVSDDRPLFAIKRGMEGGLNTRSEPGALEENQGATLDNVDLGVPGQVTKALGSVLIANDKGADSIVALHNYIRQGYADNLVMVEDTHLWANEAEGSTWAAVKADFTADEDVGIVSVKESGLVPDDVLMVSVSGNNWFRIHKASGGSWAESDLGSTSGTGEDSPPASTVGCWYGNRFWILKNDQLYFSAAYSADYSGAFDTPTDVYRVPVGTERGIVSTRDTGLIIMGNEAIWGLAPSATPVATDKPQPLVTNHGVVSKKGFVNAGDDIYYFAQDGFRALKRTLQDKLQAGVSYPLSYALKTEFENISWAYISRLCMKYFDNKIFIGVPTGAATFDTWIYFPAFGTFTVKKGWSPRCWATYKVGGEERCYYGKHGDGVVYRAWHGYTDEGTTTINGTIMTEVVEYKAEDFGQPLVYKNGGEVEIEASAVGGSDTILVEARLDGGSYSTLGTVTLTSATAPVLPVALPFTLAEFYKVRDKFHLDGLGKFREIQIRLTHALVNTEVVKIYGINITTYPEEYENE